MSFKPLFGQQKIFYGADYNPEQWLDSPEILEKDLEQIIFEADRDMLKQRGLDIKGKLFRQLKIGNYGIADLISVEKPKYIIGHGVHEPMTITIYELKKEKTGVSTFLQALGYLKGISRYLRAKRWVDFSFEFRIVCIGKAMDKNSCYLYLPDVLDILENYTYSYSLEGLCFKLQQNYHLKEEGF